MATEIRERSDSTTKKTARPLLVSKIEGCNDTIHMAKFIPHEDAVITVSADKSLRVWIKRDSGQYWPSICHYMPVSCTALEYHGESCKLFVGLSNGTITEFDLTDDLNRLHAVREYVAHMKTVRAVVFSVEYQWLLSCSNDKYMQWHSTETGRRLGGYNVSSWCTSLQFDPDSRYVFLGDYSGQISLLKLNEVQNTLSVVTTFRGHSVGSVEGNVPTQASLYKPWTWPDYLRGLGRSRLEMDCIVDVLGAVFRGINCKRSIQCLTWDPEQRWLFSGSFDQSIIIWDIGGQQGTALELQGHTNKVRGLAYAHHSKKLFSAGDDHILVIWDMGTKRLETPTWSQSDICEKCGLPFFWNFRKIWEQKLVGVRQHHCRKCGRAVCNKCSNKSSRLPLLGFEFEVRVCEECYSTINEEEQKSLAVFHDTRHSVNHLSLDLTKGRLLTCGTDNVIKIWDVRSFLSRDR